MQSLCCISYWNVLGRGLSEKSTARKVNIIVECVHNRKSAAVTILVKLVVSN